MNITEVTPVVFEGNLIGLQTVVDGKSIGVPMSKRNRFYQGILDHIIEHGAASFNGDIPTELQAAADAKLASGAYNADRV